MSYSLQEFQSIKMYHCAYQGPCPRGFHIGSKAEWQALIDALNRLGVYTASAMPTVLNIPSAYYLGRSNGSLETKYGMCRFWTSTMTSNTVAWAWGIDQNPAIVFQEDKPGNAFSIRPFKDEPVIPDSSWTEFPYGVFKNTTLGLISIQNASNWITISDKNLGATNVGDKGLYYQFGNNHGFTVNPTPYYTSKVSNTQAYGPSNYYDDEHFVRVSSGNNWFTDTNNNIRGGVDTSSLYPTEAKEVWLGNHKVRPSGWQPGANTYMYWELVSNANDTSGNNRNGTVNGTVTWNSGAVFAGSGQISSPINSMPSNFTISCWVNKTQSSASEQVLFAKWGSSYDEPQRFGMHYNGSGTLYVRQATGRTSGTWLSVGNYGYNTWHNVVFTKTGTTITVYVDGTQTNQFNYSSWDEVGTYLGIGGWTSSQRNFNGTIKDFIVENKTRTAQEVQAYYNQTKGDYGL